jgi:ATP-dependent 26S proteasome regulatory subunit
MGNELEPRPRTADVVSALYTTVELGERDYFRPLLGSVPDYHYEYLFSGNCEEVSESPIVYGSLACRLATAESNFGLYGSVGFSSNLVSSDPYWQQNLVETYANMLSQHGNLAPEDQFPSRSVPSEFFIRLSPSFYVQVQTTVSKEGSSALRLNSLTPQEFYHQMGVEPPAEAVSDTDDRYELLKKFACLWAYSHDAIMQDYAPTRASHPRHLYLDSPSDELFMPNIERIKDDVVLFDDIAGYDDIKQQLLDLALLYEQSELAENIGLDSTYGIVLHGAPGTGKTTLLRAFANEIDADVSELHVSQIIEKWVGSSAQNLDKFFASLKRHHKKIVLLMDEFDAIGASEEHSSSSERTDVVNRLKDHIVDLAHNHPNILMVAATNNLHRVDKNLVRPGRFLPVEVFAPNERDRHAIISLMLGKTAALAVIRESERPDLPNLDISDEINIDELAKSSKGLVGAHFHEILNDIRRERLRGYAKTKEMPPISHEDILSRIKKATIDIV